MQPVESAQTVLIADDDPGSLKILRETLRGLDFDIRIARDGKAAVDSALALTPDMILLDINMPVMNGYDACAILKKDIRTREVPVIFISGLNEPFNKIKAFELGAVDYLTKPIHTAEAEAKITIHIELRHRINELENFNKIMLDREMRIIELKQEVNKLASELERPAPYPEIWEV
ncbi:MAG: response regulator [Desulfobacterales bacterium]|nr:response regulator [Desulfobacterales bacterium]